MRESFTWILAEFSKKIVTTLACTAGGIVCEGKVLVAEPPWAAEAATTSGTTTNVSHYHNDFNLTDCLVLEGTPDISFYATPPSEVRFLSHAFAGRSSACIVELELVAYKIGRKEDQREL